MSTVYNGAQLVLLPIAAVERHWNTIFPMLEKAAKHGHGELKVDEVLPLVRKCLMCVHALLSPSGEILLVVASRVTGKILDVVFVSGRGGIVVLQEQFGYFAAAARVMGANQIRAYCRKSVARYLKRYLPDVRVEQGDRYFVVTREVPA